MEVNRDQQLKVNYLFTGRKDIMVTLWVREEGIGSLGADTEWNKAGLIKMDCW